MKVVYIVFFINWNFGHQEAGDVTLLKKTFRTQLINICDILCFAAGAVEGFPVLSGSEMLSGLGWYFVSYVLWQRNRPIFNMKMVRSSRNIGNKHQLRFRNEEKRILPFT
jgi:hypothetical protein